MSRTSVSPRERTRARPPVARVPSRAEVVRWLRRLGVALLVASLVLVGLRVLRRGVLPGVTVAGVDVGGLSGPDLRERLTDLERELETSSIVVRREGGGAAPRTFRTDGGALGFAIDVDATADEAMRRGRQGNPAAALFDHLRAFLATTEVDVVEEIDEATAEAWRVEAEAALSDEPREGDLRFAGAKVHPVYPEPGVGVDPDVVMGRVLLALITRSDAPVTVDAVEVEPLTDAADVDGIARRAETALVRSVTLVRGGIEVTIEPRELARLLDVRVVTSGDDGDLDLTIAPKRLDDALGDRFAALESEPLDATFAPDGAGVRVVPARPGFVFDARRAARQIVALATGGGRRRAQLRGGHREPEFTTGEARALGVTEQVSSFTTYHACCEPRVENIHRAADLIDGTIVEPGDVFSLNDALGPRTSARGFVGAPAIRDGKFVDEVGGGISQLATTFFNAVFFGGYDFLEYKAHSYYISRYPVGREATISTPVPDLEFLNDSDSGIFIDTAYTDTSITVSFYGTQDVEVESVTGERKNVQPPEEECRVNKDLAAGEEVVVQEGLEGFDIVVQRVFVYPDGETETEDFFTHYLALPRIVERRECRDPKKDRDRPRDERPSRD